MSVEEPLLPGMEHYEEMDTGTVQEPVTVYDLLDADGVAQQLMPLLSHILPKNKAKEVSIILSSEFPSLNDVCHARAETLTAIKGISKKVTDFIQEQAVFAKTIIEEKVLKNKNLMNSPGAVRQYLTREIGWEEAEIFYVLFLNTKNELIKKKRMFT